MNARSPALCLLMLSWFVAPLAGAGSFSISPTRLELGPKQRAAVVTIRNADSAPLTVQTQLVAWSQPDGEESYEDTRDILATPPVFTIPPNGEQVIRVALRAAPDASRELSYRVFFQEVPLGSESGTNALRIALRVGVPVFVEPLQKAAGRLEWAMHEGSDGRLEVEAMNQGTAHVQVTGFEISLEGRSERIPVEQMKYVLPGSRARWTIELPENLATVPASAWIIGSSDKGEFDTQAPRASRL